MLRDLARTFGPVLGLIALLAGALLLAAFVSPVAGLIAAVLLFAIVAALWLLAGVG
ncbi:MAG: hypothetical protein V9E83_14025 [Baekduia sp.]